MKSNKLTRVDYQQQQLPVTRPVEAVDFSTIARCKSFLAAVKLCISLGGFEADKQLYIPLGIDAGHWTRITRGEAHFPLEKLNDLMNLCGNEVPMLWLNQSRGYDLHSLRKLESETARALREAHERIRELEIRNRIIEEHQRAVLTGVVA